MAHLPLWLMLTLLLVWLIAPGVIAFLLLRRLHSLPLQVSGALVASLTCFIGPWLPDVWLAQHAAAMCTSVPPYTITRAPTDGRETPVPFPEREELDYGLARNKMTYKSVRTGEVLATTNSWRIGFTPMVSTVLGLSPQQRFALMDSLLPAGCSFDSRKPLPGTDTYLEKRFWQDEFKPKDLSLAAIPVKPLTSLGAGYPAMTLTPGLQNFQQAVSRDPHVHTLLISIFSKAGKPLTGDARIKVRNQFREVLWRLADSDKIDPKSRGFHIDARDLGVMERIMGTTFWGIGGPNPNEEAARVLNQAFNAVLDKAIENLATAEPLAP